MRQEDTLRIIPNSPHDIQKDSFNVERRDHKRKIMHEVMYKTEQQITERPNGIIMITPNRHVEVLKIRDNLIETKFKGTQIGEHATIIMIITIR